MKLHLTALFALILATQTHAADLETQLTGYWVPDVEKTYELARKENRTITRISRGWMPKLGWEFGSGTMLMHFQGNQAVNPPEHFSIKRVDKAKRTLVLEFEEGKPEYTAIVTGHDQLTLSWEKDKFVLNRISKEAFAKRYTPPPPVADDVTAQDIPSRPAVGSFHGVAFSVKNATLENSILVFRHGSAFTDPRVTIHIMGGLRPEEFDGKTILVKPDRTIQHPASITVSYPVEGRSVPESKYYGAGHSMKLEFGTASDGKIPGKVHFRLPGDAGSVAGTFEAELK